jgi:hypothetical protein
VKRPVPSLSDMAVIAVPAPVEDAPKTRSRAAQAARRSPAPAPALAPAPGPGRRPHRKGTSMTTMTIAPPAPAGSAAPGELDELRAAVAAARAARRRRHIDDAARVLRRTGNADLTADITGLPLVFVLRVAAQLNLGVGERDDLSEIIMLPAGPLAPAVFALVAPGWTS